MFKVLPLVCSVALLSACTVSPKSLTIDDLNSLRSKRIVALTQDQEPVSGPISLHDAMARAIKYNLDYKVQLFEEALRSSEAKLSSMNMLPQMVVTARLSGRNNYNGSVSSQILSDNNLADPSESPSTSSERNIVDSNLKLSWDILDFGLSYVRAKQSANKVLIANERKRKIINRVIANVRTAYWRAVSAERLMQRLQGFESDIQKALQASENTYKNRKTAPLVALTYQRELLEVQQQIQKMQSEMSLSKTQLAALMNVDPSTNYSLVMPERRDNLSSVNLNAGEMVKVALMNRPELRELSYEQRINKQQAEVALLEMLPNLKLFGGFSYNNNEFLYNNSWSNWGTQASWNIFNAFKYPDRKNTVKVNGEYLDQKALALTMAVVTHVHVSASQFEVARRKLAAVRKFSNVNNKILDLVASGYKARKVSYQTYVRENMNNIVAEAKYDLAYAELQNSYADLYTAIGQPVYKQVDVTSISVGELSAHLKSYWSNLRNGGGG